MKILRHLLTKEERKQYLSHVWKTEEFKASFNSKGYVYQKTKGFLDNPRVIAEMTDVQLEHSHFYSWFNVLIEKPYTNPMIQDLYYLHEIIHIATMKYDKNISYEDWQWKMLLNEINASIESEVLVYKHLPIREKSFDFIIWADELDLSKLSTSDVFFERLRASTQPKTLVEEKIAQYKAQNFKWMEIWKDKYAEIEKFLASKPNPVTFEKWVNDNSKENILFKEQAESFSWIYWQNNPNKKF